MTIRVTSSGPGSLLGAAIIPVPAKDANAWQARGMTSGNPGTFCVPAPAPIPGYDRTGVAKAIAGVGAGGMGQPSSDYSYWRPSIYYITTPTPQNMVVSYTSDNQMPVPANDPRGGLANANWAQAQSPGPAMNRPRVGGQYQVLAVRALPKFLNRTRRARRG